MTKAQKGAYQEADLLKGILLKALEGRKFRLDCGHHITFGHHLGNDLTLYNGKEFTVICSQCGY